MTARLVALTPTFWNSISLFATAARKRSMGSAQHTSFKRRALALSEQYLSTQLVASYLLGTLFTTGQSALCYSAKASNVSS